MKVQGDFSTFMKPEFIVELLSHIQMRILPGQLKKKEKKKVFQPQPLLPVDSLMFSRCGWVKKRQTNTNSCMEYFQNER